MKASAELTENGRMDREKDESVVKRCHRPRQACEEGVGVPEIAGCEERSVWAKAMAYLGGSVTYRNTTKLSQFCRSSTPSPFFATALRWRVRQMSARIQPESISAAVQTRGISSREPIGIMVEKTRRYSGDWMCDATEGRGALSASLALAEPGPPTRTNVIKGTAIVWVESSSQKEYSFAH